MRKCLCCKAVLDLILDDEEALKKGLCWHCHKQSPEMNKPHAIVRMVASQEWVEVLSDAI